MEEQLTALLVEHIMGWRPTGDRFLTGNRRWMKRWRFQPTADLRDAFRLLDEAAAEEVKVAGSHNHGYRINVRIRGVAGEASGSSIPLAICQAIARALGLSVNP